MKYLVQIALSVAVLIMAASTVQAQHIPVRSNYLFTSFMDHPAAAGNKDCLDLRLGHRNQWVGFPGAPTNSFISLSGRLGESTRAVQGIGIRVETDEAGPWGTTSASLAYSHKLKLNNQGWFSAGFSLGLSQFRLNPDGLDVTISDPAILGDQNSQFLFPMVDAGIWYQDKRSFGGLSLINATSGTLTSVTQSSQTSKIFVATGGTSLELDGRFMFRPSANMRFASGAPACFEMNGAVVYDESFSVGLGYRVQSALIGTLQISLFNYMKVGYSYDFGISRIGVASRSSHEFTLAFSACDMKSTNVHACPAYD